MWISVPVTSDVYREFIKYEHFQKKMTKINRAGILKKILETIGSDYEFEEVKYLTDKLYFEVDNDFYKELFKESDEKELKLEYMIFLKLRRFFLKEAEENERSKEGTSK